MRCLLAYLQMKNIPKDKLFKQRGWRSSEFDDMSAQLRPGSKSMTERSYLALAARTGDNVHETASVDFALVSTALGCLGLLLGLNLGSLRLDLA